VRPEELTTSNTVFFFAMFASKLAKVKDYRAAT
jgi:hypothetical protein